MIRSLAFLAVTAGLVGCVARPQDIGREPRLTPLGSGLRPERAPFPASFAQRSSSRPFNSIWHEESSDLFRDPRATKIGDVVTVKVAIRDKASLDNTSMRAREASRGLTVGAKIDVTSKPVNAKGDAAIDSNLKSGSASRGEGAISRSESIELLIAAIVTDVLPNGNLVISGTQEVRVNFELRELTVAGVVRPRDIAMDNSIAYDKIAESRISYGGHGRLTEVQQPGVVQQVLDAVSPF